MWPFSPPSWKAIAEDKRAYRDQQLKEYSTNHPSLSETHGQFLKADGELGFVARETSASGQSTEL